MKKIRFSCGHESDNMDDGLLVYVKDYNRENERAFSYMMVCKECHEMYKNEDLLLKDEQEGYDWMNEDK